MKLVLSCFAATSGSVDGVAKMSAKLPGLLIGDEGMNEARGTGVLVVLGVGVGLGDFGLKMFAICCVIGFLVGAGVGVAAGVGVGVGVGVDSDCATSPLHLISATVLGSLLTPFLILTTCQV